jgi:hypothetical protein
VVIPVSELYRTSKTSQLNTWKATVRLRSGTGGLELRLETDNNVVYRRRAAPAGGRELR